MMTNANQTAPAPPDMDDLVASMYFAAAMIRGHADLIDGGHGLRDGEVARMAAALEGLRDRLLGLMPPEEGEGRGEHGEDVGPADPIDDEDDCLDTMFDDGLGDAHESPIDYASWLMRSGLGRDAIMIHSREMFGPDIRDSNGRPFGEELRQLVYGDAGLPYHLQHEEAEASEMLGDRAAEMIANY